MNELTVAKGCVQVGRLDKIIFSKNRICGKNIDPNFSNWAKFPELMVSRYYKHVILEPIENSTLL